MPRKLSGSAIVPGTITVTQIAGSFNETSNASYSQANSARNQANSAYGQANSGVTIAGNAYGQANAARTQANTARDQANTARTTANDSYGVANSAATNALNAYAQANSGVTIAGNSYGQANAARDQANTARGQANAAYGQANAAYGAANTRLSASGGTLSGDLIITGNLTVSGNQTILNTEVLTTEDADIVLLSNTSSTPALNAGLIVNRGTSTNTFLRWNEALDEWGWSDNGTTTYYFDDLRAGLATTNTTFGTINTSLGTINTSYQAAYAQANTAGTNALNAYGQANAARTQANSGVTIAGNAYGAANNRVLKAGDTMTGQLNISSGGLLVTGNLGIGTASPVAPLTVLTTNSTDDSTARVAVFGLSQTNMGQLEFRSGRDDNAFTNRYSSIQAWSNQLASARNLILQPEGGNVGIGTTSPAAKLHVKGTWVNNEGILQIDADSGTQYSGLTIQNNGTAAGFLYHDNTAGTFNLYTPSGSIPIVFSTNNNERMRISSGGDVQIGNATNAGDTLRFLDVYNTNTGSSAGAILRLITANTAGSGTTSVDIVKYKNGSFFINNNEPDSSAYTAFNIGSTERFRITPTGIVTGSSRLAMGNALISTKTLDPTKWYRIATLSASNEGHEVDLRVRIPGTHAVFVIRLSKGTGNWVAQAYRAGHYIAPTTGYTAINKVRIYDVGVNAETHIEIQVAGATESKQYEVVVVNSVTPSTSRPTLVDFTDQGTGSAGVEFLVTEVNASWGTPSGQNVVFRDNGNVGIGTGTTLPGVRLDVAGSIRASQSITIGNGGGTYQAGSIYSDSNWGMLFRGAQASPGVAQFSWHNSADTVLMRMDASGHTTHVGRFGVNNAATDATFVFAVASGRTRLQANSELYALGVRYNTTTGYYYIGATNSGSPSLTFCNNGGAERARLSDAGGFSVGTTADPGTGAIFATGEITAFYSDDRLKNRIGNIDNALSKVLTLNGFYYEPNETAMDLGYEKKKQVGVSAQEVKEVLPEVVVAAPIDEKYMTVHYHKLVPLLIEAIKELNTKIEDMQKIIESKG